MFSYKVTVILVKTFPLGTKRGAKRVIPVEVKAVSHGLGGKGSNWATAVAAKSA